MITKSLLEKNKKHRLSLGRKIESNKFGLHSDETIKEKLLNEIKFEIE